MDNDNFVRFIEQSVFDKNVDISPIFRDVDPKLILKLTCPVSPFHYWIHLTWTYMYNALVILSQKNTYISNSYPRFICILSITTKKNFLFKTCYYPRSVYQFLFHSLGHLLVTIRQLLPLDNIGKVFFFIIKGLRFSLFEVKL